MGVFSTKRTPEQRAELQEFTKVLQVVRQQSEQGLMALHPEVWDLYNICNEALLENRNPEAATAGLIEKATERIQCCRDSLADAQAKLLSTEPSSWYPRKHRKAHASWGTYLRAALVGAKIAIEALESPEPLRHDPTRGYYTLNDFVRGLAVLVSVRKSYLPKEL